MEPFKRVLMKRGTIIGCGGGYDHYSAGCIYQVDFERADKLIGMGVAKLVSVHGEQSSTVDIAEDPAIEEKPVRQKKKVKRKIKEG